MYPVQKKARLVAEVSADQGTAENLQRTHQQSARLSRLNGSSSAQIKQLGKPATSFTNNGREGIQEVLPPRAVSMLVGGKEPTKPGSTDKQASEESRPGPFGSNSRGGDIFGSRPSRQRASGIHNAKVTDEPASASSRPLLSQMPGHEAASKTYQTQGATVEGSAGFGKTIARAFGSENRMPTSVEHKSPDPVLKQVLLDLRSRLLRAQHQPVGAAGNKFVNIAHSSLYSVFIQA